MMGDTSREDDHASRGAAPIAVSAPSASAATMPAAVPSSDIAPGVPGFTRLKPTMRNVDRPQALPISLATVSLPPAASAAVNASIDADVYGVATALMAASVATPQL